MLHKLTLAYDGTNYEGWQLQISPRQPKTIQGAVEAAIHTLTGALVRVTASGRTDAGVHALAQTAHARLPARPWDWRHRLNGVLPEDVRIIEAVPAPPGFHARKSAIAKTYFYNFWIDPAFMPPCQRLYAWQCGRLDLEAMRAALPHFLGRHDFASFRNAGDETRSTEREIFDIELAPLSTDYAVREGMIRLRVRGSGFLKQMVRNMAGCLVQIGKGRLDADDLPAILAACDRQALRAPTAPARGLFLAGVEYPYLPPTTNARG